ncbi:WD40 repeat-like protein [Saccharata proteae CBS 121410]|uniref:WD40 repeat-like protein n=1 Tax=Saccharata proteae CBS 121410 TaxID=1314787 RepID=A0A9P4HMT5_9PEZI|nr:WD40 repeat-like protein [Saccharata proteae CBS 121410]
MAGPPNVPPAGATPGAAAPSQQNLNHIVLEYLSKKGYARTEAMLRKESAHQDADGRPQITRAEDRGGPQYEQSFELLRNWIEDNLELYKAELRRTLWPVFVYSFLNLAADFYTKDCETFFNKYKDMFTKEHDQDLRALTPIRLPEHVSDSQIAKVYRGNKYRITLTNMAFNSMMQFLETKEKEGGSVIMSLFTNHFNLVTVDRVAGGTERSLAAMIAKGGVEDDIPAEDEGIPGHNPGSANTDRNAPPVLAKLALGPLPMEQELQDDVRAELQEEDAKNPPKPGQNSLVEEFEQRIKREGSEEAPSRETAPLPPSLARDVLMEVQKVKENRDRFKIEGRTGGIGPGITVCMYTFHNTFDSITCIEFSDDQQLVAAGMSESYIRVWSMDGKALPSAKPNDKPSASRRLIGHSGPICAISFAPATASPTPGVGPSTASKYLLSCSADKTIRLWSLETWTCLTAYKGHNQPVWDVQWGPFGHYFLSASHDRTARLWTTDHPAPHRLYVGHDDDVDAIAWHPNGAYIFTASSGDRTIRMWHINGNALRMFTGHTGAITAISCSPNGKRLASADDKGDMFLWDIAAGSRIKRMRGHGKGGIWSLSWSVESSVLVSGGADGTVRVWDVLAETSESSGAAGAGGATGANGKVVGEGGAGVKKKGEMVVTPDQISAFPTKKSPVYKVGFTRMNLVLAGGAYLPG